MKAINNFFFFISLVIVVLLLYFSNFNNFQSDDYWYAQSKHIGVLNHAIKLYLTQGGRYFSYSVNAAVPIDYPLFPKIYPVLLLLLFIISLFINFKLFFEHDNRTAFNKSILFFFVYETLLLSISEHFYWYSGINVYFLPIIFCSFFIFFYKKYSLTQRKLYLIPVVILSLFIVGSNEVLLIIFYAFLVLESMIRKAKWKFLVLLLVSCFLIFNITSPGNLIRLSKGGENFSVYRSLFLKIYGFIMNGIWIFLKSIFVVPLILFFFRKEMELLRNKITFKHSFILLIPPLFSLIFIGIIMFIQGRANDSILISFAFLISFILSYRIESNKYIALLSLMIVFSPKIYLYPKRDNLFLLNYNNFDIVNEILFTNLKGFDAEVKQRRTTIESSKEDVIVLSPIYNRPRVLYFEEMGRLEKPNYINNYLKNYYNKTIGVKYRYDKK